MIERSVVPDSRSTDEDGRWSGGGGDGFDEPTGGAHAAVENALLLRVGPALGGDWFASEIDHRVGAVDFRQPCAAWSVRRPLHESDARRRADPGRAPGEEGDVVFRFGQGLGERLAEKSRAAGDDNLHGGVSSPERVLTVHALGPKALRSVCSLHSPRSRRFRAEDEASRGRRIVWAERGVLRGGWRAA